MSKTENDLFEEIKKWGSEIISVVTCGYFFGIFRKNVNFLWFRIFRMFMVILSTVSLVMFIFQLVDFLLIEKHYQRNDTISSVGANNGYFEFVSLLICCLLSGSLMILEGIVMFYTFKNTYICHGPRPIQKYLFSKFPCAFGCIICFCTTIIGTGTIGLGLFPASDDDAYLRVMHFVLVGFMSVSAGIHILMLIVSSFFLFAARWYVRIPFGFFWVFKLFLCILIIIPFVIIQAIFFLAGKDSTSSIKSSVWGMSFASIVLEWMIILCISCDIQCGLPCFWGRALDHMEKPKEKKKKKKEKEFLNEEVGESDQMVENPVEEEEEGEEEVEHIVETSDVEVGEVEGMEEAEGEELGENMEEEIEEEQEEKEEDTDNVENEEEEEGESGDIFGSENGDSDTESES